MSGRVPVAVFLTSFDAGGTERQMIELIRRLDPRRFAVHAVCFHRRGAWLPLVEGSGAAIAEFPIGGFGRAATWQQMRTFAAWCRQQDIAVVHTCDFYANVFGLPAAAWARVPLRIGSRRDLNPGRTGAQSLLQRLAYAAAHRVVANSRAAADRLIAERVPARRVSVIANGVDPARFPPRTPRDGSLRRVITVANLRAEKAHEVLIEAAALLAPTHPDVEYLIVGDGARRDELQRLIQARGLERQVLLLGHREDVPALLAEADLYVLPSRTEAFPNGIIEAMAAGLPVVACGVGGMLELVEPGRTGALVPPDDAAALAEAVRGMLASPERARAMGAAGRHDVEARFSFDRMVAEFEQLYLSALAGRGAAATAPLAAS
jgi:glycosyltransferase involved in cell wall biosynthesis